MLPEIPGFTIVEMIGEGAMARVFLAIQKNLNRKVALKVMNQSLAHDPAFRDRFLAEAEDTAKFIHPGIVTIYNTDVFDDNYYLVLEYLEAGTLKDRQRARQKANKESGDPTAQQFTEEEVLALMAELADALAYAHSKNVIHRDLKPANIMFRSDGRAVLSDFGIAKSVTENRELTLTGFSVGTPAYMSPEQKLGANIDTRSDLYSLGVVFFELLTGHKPFHTRTGNYADLRKELDAEVPQLPPERADLQPMLNKLLAKDPAERYQSASELLKDIQQISGHSSFVDDDATVIQLGSGAAGGPAATGKKNKPLKVALITLLAVAMIGGGAIATMKFMPEPPVEVAVVDEKTAAEIEMLLESADFFLEEGPLINAGPSHAVAGYERVLTLQSGNPRAIQGLKSALEKILVKIQADIDSGDQEAAQQLIQLAELHFPDNEDLAELREKTGG